MRVDRWGDLIQVTVLELLSAVTGTLRVPRDLPKWAPDVSVFGFVERHALSPKSVLDQQGLHLGLEFIHGLQLGFE